ncbi:hypothetical protein BO85DRAFT_439830 [Aspergillus piperis CBS 112811]|uniref:Uncharacterized protein n=1 Tax=Aspergillus piperis CBS 112811 TaxID=1448313 RepID=A0A8G1VL79_9EURO|nr:hypothetical protein BO85DRAFT_439830 [Aspergillus piperis CBS 112811]RAH56122.1 hypothetical protein BO85DRAFT_439830 [Aspergillus piperis CBS 112811]
MDKIVSFSNWLKVVKAKSQPVASMYASTSNGDDNEPPKKRQKVSHHSPFAADGVVEEPTTQDDEQSIRVIEGEVVEFMGIDDYESGAPLKRVPTPHPKKNEGQYDDDDEDEEGK